ncbi:hypothetical protein L1285_16905 [Pseudoalteromonas sp. DL2-H2.2]|uniref:hypothetical protein n=1 Tax=Pseudoalteromonas sp. DL2-H2.2 TaxID=2908889 RepID=UPI001F3ACEC4|nr:hypothetical protein [Pseudoalteromonas sp. DL2-H2.2]MCF2910002.1 hypothetical protein [Pseudoalteromonas sp. DL2-H2.2]
MKRMIFASLLTLLSTSINASGSGAGIWPLKKEADFVEFHCKGQVEYRLPDKTRVDCLTDQFAIEYDWGKKWAEAVGQALYYSAMTGKKAGIVLIVNTRTKERYLRRIEKTIEDKKLDITVWTVNTADRHAPKKFM